MHPECGKSLDFKAVFLHRSARANLTKPHLHNMGEYRTHTKKSFLKLVKSNRNQIVFTIFRLIWNQTGVCFLTKAHLHTLRKLDFIFFIFSLLSVRFFSFHLFFFPHFLSTVLPVLTWQALRKLCFHFLPNWGCI